MLLLGLKQILMNGILKDGILASELAEAMNNREIYLATLKQNRKKSGKSKSCSCSSCNCRDLISKEGVSKNMAN